MRKKKPSKPAARSLLKRKRPPKQQSPALQRNATAALADASSPELGLFPIVGIGASAGGLEAFKVLLSHTPIDTGMAFVLIQHLDPKHESLSSEILARSTRMPVQEVKDGMRVQQNNVYVIPPNCNLGLAHGSLKILPRTESRGQHLPLDCFFRALAEERKTHAIGVVLSGTASDGTLGLRAIKAEGGITLVQDPDSAKYDGMPRSAIASGAVDLIRTPEGIAAELARIAKHPYVIPHGAKSDQKLVKKDDNLARIFSLLRSSSSVDFSHYKNNTLQRRISRRMLLQKTDDLAKYAKYLEGHPDEVKALFADILIHVTGFFRDKTVFDALRTRFLPKYLKNRDPSLPFRMWVPGCSTGEEAYSLAMTFLEFRDEYQKNSRHRGPLSIFATEISEQALAKARAAIYPDSISEEVSKERLRRFFEKVEGGYRISKSLRDTCLFSRHDVTRDPPFAKVDLISCRNVLIYFDAELQKLVLPIFHYALNPDAILVLGKSETIGGFSNLFSLADKTNKVYSKVNVSTPLKMQFPLNRYSIERLEPGYKTSEPMPGRIDVKRELERISLSEYSPPCVVINEAFEIVQSQGNTAPFLGLSAGHPSFNLLRMAHSELIADLRSAVQGARKKDAPVIREGLSLHDDGRLRTLSIKVLPIPAPFQSKERYFTIFFEEIKDHDPRQTKGRAKARAETARESTKNLPALKDKHHLEMLKKLSANQEYQQSLIEEYETSQEELVSSNEELQSTNEELQSTNEEMETAKEELQSANEELTTVNDEMQTRNTEMINVTNDLTNLLASVDIPIVMVGPDGKIRRFTPKAAVALKLIPTDVGRPIGDIKPNIQAPDLEALVSEVMQTMSPREVETRDNQGHWHQLQVRPYRTADNKIDGAVIALLDIDSLKKNAEDLKTAAEELKKSAGDLKKAGEDAGAIIESQPVPLLVIDSNHRVKLANKIFYKYFKVSRAEIEGQPASDLFGGRWKIPQLQKLIEATLTQGTVFDRFEVDHDFPHIGPKMMFLSSRMIHLPGSGETVALLSLEDVTERLSVERALKDSEEKYRNLVANAHDGIVIVSEDGKIEFINQQIEKMFGYSTKELMGQFIEVLLPTRVKYGHIAHRIQYASHPTAREMGSKLDLFGSRKDGTEFSVDVFLSPLKSHSGTYVTAIIRDISERKEIERERAKLLVYEQKANLIKDEFLATLSHELRTPLTTILSWVQLMRMGKLDAEKTRRGIEILEQSAKAQGQLIDDLLDISRIQAGKLNLAIQKIDPAKVISAAVDSTRSLAAGKSIQIEVAINPSIKHIFADPVRLQQILWNLITNAIKFSAQGGRIWITLDLIMSTGGERIRVQVRDIGKGIKAEFIPIIFERFTQVDSTSTRSYGGLGLGLAIVRKLVEMHSGGITVESPGEGKGATFTIFFPVKPGVSLDSAEAEAAADAEAEAEAAAEAEAEAEVTLRGLRVLLVDDEASAREVFGVMIQSFGAVVKTAESAIEALAVIEKFNPDVLVSDIAMPLEDGYSLIGKIRALKSKLGQIPALALTAYAGREDIQRTHLAGFQSHVAKPVDANKLALAIARLVKRK